MKVVKILSLAVALSIVAAQAAVAEVSVTSTGAKVDGTTVTAAGAEIAAGNSVSLNVEGAPVLVSMTPTSVTLSWNKVSAAVSYIVKYSKKSVATSTDPNAVYDNESAPVTETGAAVENLAEGATYFFAVVAMDKSGNESDSLSEELEVNLSKPASASGAAATSSGAATSGTMSNFALKSVTPQNTRTMAVEFSAALGTDPVSLKVTKTSNSASIAVKSVVTDVANPNTALVTLDSDLESDSTYTLTIISAKDAEGNNIPAGINAIKEFTTIAGLAPAVEVPLNAGPDAVAATGAVAAPSALPATGTKENLLLILALVSSLGIVFAIRKKAA